MLYNRQKTLLALLDALGGSVGGLDFQKLLFLYCLEEQRAPSYQFVPYRFGGFSFTSYADKRRLIQRGLLVDEERLWKLTDAGRRAMAITSAARKKLEGFAKRYSGLRGDALVAETYRRYPYYATRSEIAESLLGEEPLYLAAVREARPHPTAAGVSTIGYEGRSLEAYLNRLITAGVTLLCDVRRNPLSRKYGFSKSTLSKACIGVGIRYEHLPELGIASEDRRSLETGADYDALFARYRRDVLRNQSKALSLIKQWVEEGHRVALTCFESEPRRCHRHCVADALRQEFGIGFAPTHL
jgi:hypothetical protein